MSRWIKTYSLLCRSGGMEVIGFPWWDVGIGTNLLTVSRSCVRTATGSICPCGVATKSPGTVSGAPYTSSTKELLKSSFGAVGIPNKTHGSSSSQLAPVSRARKADFRFR